MKYIMIETKYDSYRTYGIALADFSAEVPVIVKSVPDLSSDKERVYRFTVLCTRLELSPLHLADVVDDFLAE